MGRDHSLDGLRGVAAFAVVLFHFCCAFIPRMIPEETSSVSWITDTPLSVFYNGPYAVVVFFVLSGIVVSASAAKRRYPVALNIGLRWVRLGAPALASAIFAWILISLFPNALAAVKAAIPHPWLTYTYAGGPTPPFWQALYEGAVGCFLDKGSNFNNVLWTMQAELIASVAIYLVYGFTSGRVRLAVIGACALLPLLDRSQFYYEGFVLGCLIQEFGPPKVTRWGWALLAVGLLAGSIYNEWPTRHGLPELPSVLKLGYKAGLLYVLGAAALVVGVMTTPRMQAWLSTWPAQWLGRLSFPLYLVHVPLLYTLMAGLYPVLPLGALFAVFLVATFAAAMGMMLLVDGPVLGVIRAAQQRFGRRQPALAEASGA